MLAGIGIAYIAYLVTDAMVDNMVTGTTFAENLIVNGLPISFAVGVIVFTLLRAWIRRG